MALPRGVEFFPILNTFAATTRRGGGQNVLTPEAPPVITPTPTEPGMPTPQLPPEEPENLGRRRLLAALGGLGLGLAVEATPLRLLVNPAVEKAFAYWNSIITNISAATEQSSSSFNKEATSGRITGSNTYSASIETINEELEKQKGLGKATETTLLFPLVVPNDSDVISYEYMKRFKGFDPKAGKNIEEDNRSWMQLPKVPGKTIVIAPIDADVFAYGPKVKTGMVQGIGMKFTIDGIMYTLKISGTTLNEIFRDLNNLPDLREYQNNQGRVHFKRGAALLELQEKGSDLQVSLTSTPVGSSKNEENPVDINFLSTFDKTGINKLVVLPN